MAKAWQQAVSLPSIQQVVEENGLGEPQGKGVVGGGVQGELFDMDEAGQLFRKSWKLSELASVLDYAMISVRRLLKSIGSVGRIP